MAIVVIITAAEGQVYHVWLGAVVLEALWYVSVGALEMV